jgi:hypothetical protein
LDGGGAVGWRADCSRCGAGYFEFRLINVRNQALLAAVVLAAVVGVVVASRVGVAHVRKSSSGAVAVLLEDNSLLMLGRTRGVVNRVRLARPSAQPMGGRYLARTRSGNLVAVAPGRKKDVLAIVNARGRVIRRVTLPSGIHFRAIELGASTGRVFLGGEITTTRATKFGTLAKTAVLTVMSLSGQGFATTKLRRPDGHGSRLGPLDWSIYDIAVSRDEQRVYVSYHGSNTDGGTGSMLAATFRRDACPRRSLLVLVGAGAVH